MVYLIKKTKEALRRQAGTIIPHLLIINILLIVIIPSISADVYVGTCEGVIYNTESQTVEGATVTVTVDQCVIGCSQQTTSEPTGYYVTANLNLPKFETVSVYAEKSTALGLEYGSATGTADGYQAAEVDVTICLPPPTPSLTPEPNTHETEVTLQWISYSDKKGYSTYDEFKIDSQSTVQDPNSGTKTKDISGLTYTSHTWKVRTCNSYCCSSWVSDTFSVGNSAPSQPVLTTQEDTTPGEVTFSWTSGTDPDGDITYDEFCYGIIDEEQNCIEDVQSPQTIEVFGCNYYTWKVRTCEVESQNLCSSWSTNGFIACGLECPECFCSPCGGGGGGSGGTCRISEEKIHSLAVISPLPVDREENITLRTSYKTSGTSKNLWLKIKSDEFNFNDYFLSAITDAKATFELTGKAKPETEPGIHNVTLEILSDNKIIFTEEIPIYIKKPLYITIQKIAQEFPKKKNLWIFPVLIVLILTVIYLCLKYRKEYIFKQKSKKTKKS